MKKFLAATALSLSLTAAVPAYAGIDDAINAYNTGQFDVARQEFESLAADGNGEAAFYLGRMYQFGEGVPENQSQALTWFRKSADLDHADGHFVAGQMYEKGLGTPQDYDRAFASYEAASDMGHLDARKRLAMMHAEGLGTQVDYVLAAQLLNSAAEQGDQEARDLLTYLMNTGRVPKDALDEPIEDEGVTAGAETTVPAGPMSDVDRVRAYFEQRLGSVDMGDDPEAEADLLWDLNVAEAEDGTITADLTNLALVGKEASWQIGDWQTVMTPAGEGLYETVVNMPTATAFLDGQGREIGGTVVGNQRFTGLYSLNIDQFVTLDAAAEDIRVDARPPGEQPFDMTIASLTAVGNLVESAPGKWSGPQEFAMNALRAGVPGEGDLTIDRMWMDAQSGAIDYEFFRKLQEEMQSLEQAMPDDVKPADEKVLAQTIQAAFARLRDGFAQHEPIAQAYVSSGGAEGLRFADDKGVVQFAMDRLTFGMGFERLDQPASLMTINYSHDGLGGAPDEEVPEAYLPRSFDLNIELDNLPVQDAIMMALEMAEGAAADPQNFEAQMETSLMFMGLGLQQQMVVSGAVIRINALNYHSDALDFVMSGEIKASDASPNGLIGHIDLAITGMDKALEDLKSAEKGSDEEDFAMALAMLQPMGTRTEVDGRSHHAYAFDFTPDGQMLLNGNDMQPLIGGMME